MSRRKNYSQGFQRGYEQATRDIHTAEAERRCPDGVVDFVEPTEFEEWRELHKAHKEPGGLTPRCPRCFSTKVAIVHNSFGSEVLYCRGCRLSEQLIDFPSARPGSGCRRLIDGSYKNTASRC